MYFFSLLTECDGCGLHFPTHQAYHMHRMDSCKVKRGSKNGGTKVKRSNASLVQNSHSNSGFDGLAEVKSEANSLLSSADLQVTASTSSQGHTSLERSNLGNLKVEKIEQPQQPVLGAVTQAGENWKCGICLAVFTSGMELFQVSMTCI